MTNNFKNYYEALNEAAKTVDQTALDKAYDLLLNNIDNVVIFGNGGSAAIADHFCCDFVKGVRSDTNLAPRCTSLVSNGPLLTALSNDRSYDSIFSNQIYYHNPSLAIAVSSSGNSKNILEGLHAAEYLGRKEDLIVQTSGLPGYWRGSPEVKNLKTIALVGFDGGQVLSENMADVIIHVNSDNYGIVEDVHMMILHSLVQKIRIEHSVRGDNLKL